VAGVVAYVVVSCLVRVYVVRVCFERIFAVVVAVVCIVFAVAMLVVELVGQEERVSDFGGG
jgi:hypothetical protein